MTQSAYLLFYRRRADGPLGGERFKQILEDYDNPPDSQDDDTAESGEEQGLVGNTFRGSSSALTGVGAAPRRPNHGSASADTMTVYPAALESLPAYQAHEINDEDAAPLLASDAVMNDGLQLQDSIEDEGIDVGINDGMNYTNVGYDNLNSHGTANFLESAWNFDHLPNSRSQISGTASDIDDGASDRVQHNSSASEGSIRGRMEDFRNAIPEDDGIFVDQSPVPDLDEDAQMNAIVLQSDLLERQRGPAFRVAPEAEDETTEETATEIHVEEGEGLNK